jgi:hypothetical protein
MLAPAMTIAPVRPGTHAQEDAAIEITRAIVATGCASVWRITIVPIDTYRWSYADGNLRVDRWHQGQGG